MKRLYIPVIFSVLMVLPFIGWSHLSSKKEKGKKYPSIYKSNIIIDGKATEWEDSLFFLNSDTRIAYAVVNDSNNLYLCLKVYDDNQQMKLLRGGMDVWIDPSGKKSESCGIRFPLNTTLNPWNKPGIRTGDPSAVRQVKLMYLLQAKDMELTGFRDGINGFMSTVVSRTGLKPVLKLDSTNILIYEAKIPYSVFKTDLVKANPLSVGFIIKGIERPKMQEREDSRGGGMDNRENAGGMGGRIGGEGGGGYGGGHFRQDGNRNDGGEPASAHQSIFDDTPMWIRIVIAH